MLRVLLFIFLTSSVFVYAQEQPHSNILNGNYMFALTTNRYTNNTKMEVNQNLADAEFSNFSLMSYSEHVADIHFISSYYKNYDYLLTQEGLLDVANERLCDDYSINSWKCGSVTKLKTDIYTALIVSSVTPSSNPNDIITTPTMPFCKQDCVDERTDVEPFEWNSTQDNKTIQLKMKKGFYIVGTIRPYSDGCIIEGDTLTLCVSGANITMSFKSPKGDVYSVSGVIKRNYWNTFIAGVSPHTVSIRTQGHGDTTTDHKNINLGYLPIDGDNLNYTYNFNITLKPLPSKNVYEYVNLNFVKGGGTKPFCSEDIAECKSNFGIFYAQKENIDGQERYMISGKVIPADGDPLAMSYYFRNNSFDISYNIGDMFTPNGYDLSRAGILGEWLFNNTWGFLQEKKENNISEKFGFKVNENLTPILLGILRDRNDSLSMYKGNESNRKSGFLPLGYDVKQGFYLQNNVLPQTSVEQILNGNYYYTDDGIFTKTSSLCPSGQIELYTPENPEYEGKCYTFVGEAQCLDSGQTKIGNECYVKSKDPDQCPSDGRNYTVVAPPTYSDYMCQTTTTPQCRAGQRRIGEFCYDIGSIMCPSGYTWDATAKKCSVSPTCPSGQVRIGESCYTVSHKTCPSGFSWNPSLSQCVANPSCPSGQVRIGESCYSKEINTNVEYRCSSPITLNGKQYCVVWQTGRIRTGEMRWRTINANYPGSNGKVYTFFEHIIQAYRYPDRMCGCEVHWNSVSWSSGVIPPQGNLSGMVHVGCSGAQWISYYRDYFYNSVIPNGNISYRVATNDHGCRADWKTSAHRMLITYNPTYIEEKNIYRGSSCPSGSYYNSSLDLCISSNSGSCSSEQLEQSNGCYNYAGSSCPSGTIYGSTTDKCYLNTENFCQTGYTFYSEYGQCLKQSQNSCAIVSPYDYIYNSETDSCIHTTPADCSPPYIKTIDANTGWSSCFNLNNSQAHVACPSDQYFWEYNGKAGCYRLEGQACNGQYTYNDIHQIIIGQSNNYGEWTGDCYKKVEDSCADNDIPLRATHSTNEYACMTLKQEISSWTKPDPKTFSKHFCDEISMMKFGKTCNDTGYPYSYTNYQYTSFSYLYEANNSICPISGNAGPCTLIAGDVYLCSVDKVCAGCTDNTPKVAENEAYSNIKEVKQYDGKWYGVTREQYNYNYANVLASALKGRLPTTADQLAINNIFPELSSYWIQGNSSDEIKTVVMVWTNQADIGFVGECVFDDNYNMLCTADMVECVNNTCPYGSQYVCQSYQGKSYCSRFSAKCGNLSDPNVGYENEDENNTEGLNDKKNDAEIDDQGNCLGNIYIFNGKDMRCRKSGVETLFTDCCKKTKNFLGMENCKETEKMLSSLRKWGELDGNCHYVGEYCAKKFFGICLQKKKTYCCFSSPLGRIIHEQARPQLGIDFGSAKDPNCRGFTPEEFQKINWDKVDLTEYIELEVKGEIVPNMSNKLGESLKNIQLPKTSP